MSWASRQVGGFLGLAAGVACASAVTSVGPPPAAAPAPPVVQQRELLPVPPLALEGRDGVLGQPRDETAFEYGDERDPKMRALLEEISPLHHAERIQSALLVAHGANDPRVPVSEAEAIVERVRATGRPVAYLLARSEGHSFRKRINRDRFYQAMATFFSEHLLGDPSPEVELQDVSTGPPDDEPEGPSEAATSEAPGDVKPAEGPQQPSLDSGLRPDSGTR